MTDRPAPAERYVYDFAEGSKDRADLLGGKGANLAEMTHLGLPVPPGFIITTEACLAYLAAGRTTSRLEEEIREHLATLEAATGRRLGDSDDPLLVSARSGARFSMPGMMETVLDIGLNDRSVHGLARASGDARFAWDSYRRLIQMYGETVLDVPGADFDDALAAACTDAGVAETDLPADALERLVGAFKQIVARYSGRAFPQDPHVQLFGAIQAVFRSWNSERAVAYRQREQIPPDLGTAVTVMAMVYGNLGDDSGTGVAFTRDPATGARGVYGDYLVHAQGEDVVAGGHDTMPLSRLAEVDPGNFARLTEIMEILERHYRDLCDIEFTIERGTLWMLQTRVGKRTAAAAFVIACQLVDEGVISLDEALWRVNGSQLAQLMFPAFAPRASDVPLTRGVPASPGAAVGAIALDSATAMASSVPVVLVRRETTPDDLPGMIAARGILTSHGGKTSHAAVVARGMGTTCVCGAGEVEIDLASRTVTINGVVLNEGDVISVDGTSGSVLRGEVPLESSPVVRYFEHGMPDDAAPVVRAVDRLLRYADEVRRLAVWANADTPEDAARARRFGATGIGLCRTEHQFLGERRELIERVVLAADEPSRDSAIQALLPLQRADFVGILRAMNGLPVTVRLIDPPLHEFLPRLEEVVARVARADALGLDDAETARDRLLLPAVRRMHEENPMLGLRGVRLGLVMPELFAMQARAVAEAAAELVREGLDPRPEIMVPLVASSRELEATRTALELVIGSVRGAPKIPVGTMIEVPRAALTAGRIAAHAEFFSFGTNDLTQMTWGFSRDDAEAAFLPAYLELGVLDVSPFESLDASGVGRLIELAVEAGRAARPQLQLGVCGEHGGDPASIHFFDRVGLDYVSCSPFRVPVARLEGSRASLAGAARRAGVSRL